MFTYNWETKFLNVFKPLSYFSSVLWDVLFDSLADVVIIFVNLIDIHLCVGIYRFKNILVSLCEDLKLPSVCQSQLISGYGI